MVPGGRGEVPRGAARAGARGRRDRPARPERGGRPARPMVAGAAGEERSSISMPPEFANNERIPRLEDEFIPKATYLT